MLIEPVGPKADDGTPRLPEVERAIHAISRHLCEAQSHLFTESAKLLSAMDQTEFELPTVYRQSVNERGESELTKVSSIRMPLSSILPQGVFLIHRMDVDLPVSFDGASRKPMEATLKLTYVFRPLPGLVPPVTLKAEPYFELEILHYEVNPRVQGRCRARAALTGRHGETGRPLAGARVHLSLESGNVIPVSADLDAEGRLEFDIAGACDEAGRFRSELGILAVGTTRTIDVSLCPEGAPRAP